MVIFGYFWHFATDFTMGFDRKCKKSPFFRPLPGSGIDNTLWGRSHMLYWRRWITHSGWWHMLCWLVGSVLLCVLHCRSGGGTSKMTPSQELPPYLPLGGSRNGWKTHVFSGAKSMDFWTKKVRKHVRITRYF